MSTPFETVDLAHTTCRSCSAVIAYEPIICFGRDLAAGLHTVCDDCSAAEDARAASKEREATTERRETILRTVIPPDLLATDVNYPDFNRKLWAVASKWHPSQNDRSIGIIGHAGQCKTRVLSLLAKRVILRGTRVVWTSAVRLKDAATDRSSRLPNVAAIAREHLADCLHAPWLFIDDIGKNEWSPAFESQFFQILDHRINYRLPFAWSANDHPEAFSQSISKLNASPIIGRILDRCTIIDLRPNP